MHLTHAVIYMAMSPKSNSMEVAYNMAKIDAIENMADPVPLQLRNAPTKLMRELDYGKGYKYAHDYEEKITAMECLPESLSGKSYYHPTDQGNESKYKERLQKIKEWKRDHR